MSDIDRLHIAVVGLGYVGLPLAVRLATRFRTTGFDINGDRVAELRRGHDRTREIDCAQLAATTLALVDDPAACAGADVYIVTVPTPVDAANQPDLSLVHRASETVAGLLDGTRRPIVVYESTVYPGVTEEECGPILERVSGLTRGRDFFLGYSPERINPGDSEHGIERITKVVAGENPAVTEKLSVIYGQITAGGTFAAPSIRVAEAAKVIENAQRDINIAFINEVTQIVGKLGLSVWDVLEAAGTKWNFLPFRPGLVGGHCIGVDPFYLSHCAEAVGHEPAVVLAGRATNDAMGNWVADRFCAGLSPPASILVLGLTFKENVPDLRNSKVVDVVARLRAHGHAVAVHDPQADPAEALRDHGIALLETLPEEQSFDAVLLAVAHDSYVAMSDRLIALVRPDGLFGDLKNAVRPAAPRDDLGWWRL